MDLYQAQQAIREIENKIDALDIMRRRFGDNQISKVVFESQLKLGGLVETLRTKLDSGEFD